MTLPASPPITTAQIATEYGLTPPWGLRSLLGKPGLPSSGNLSTLNFLGKSNFTHTMVAGSSFNGTSFDYGYFLSGSIGTLSPTTYSSRTFAYIYANEFDSKLIIIGFNTASLGAGFLNSMTIEGYAAPRSAYSTFGSFSEYQMDATATAFAGLANGVTYHMAFS